MANPTRYIVTTSQDPLRVWVSPGSSTVLGLLSKGLVVDATGNVTPASNGRTYAEIIMPIVGSTVDGRAGWCDTTYLADASDAANQQAKQQQADAAQAAGLPNAPPPNSTTPAPDITPFAPPSLQSDKPPTAMATTANVANKGATWPLLLLAALAIGGAYYYVSKKKTAS